MISADKLCRDCKRKDLCPSPDQPTEIDCPCCNAAGCEECGENGWFELTECARRRVPREIWETLMYCDWFEKGHPPVAGGMLDQDRWFVDACTFVLSERARLIVPKDA